MNEQNPRLNPVRAFPGGMTASSDEVAVALLVVGGMGLLTLLRKGLKGVGPIDLTGSTMGAVEWFAYMAVVGTTVRVVTARFPDHPLSKALAFAY